MKPIDYTKFNQTGDDKQAELDKRWWLAPKADRPQAVAKVVKMLSDYDSRRQTQFQISTRLYGNTQLVGLNGLSYSKIASTQNQNKDRITYNVCQAVVDTITAKISKNKPKPMFLTSGGDYKLQRKAKKLDKFVEGVFYENEAYRLGTKVFRDSTIFGDGIVHVFEHYGRVAMERIIPSELYTDWFESFYGYPRQLHRVKAIDRNVLIDLFPGHEKDIREANSASADIIGAYQNIADQINVVESWHLPSGPEASDGLHTINIVNANLFEEKYDKPFFPFAKLSWSERVNGYWGQGLVEQIQNLQLELNKLLWVVQRSMHLAGTFKVWIKNGGKIVKEHLNNDIGAIIASDEEPKYLLPPIVQPEVYAHLNTIKTAAFEQAGISQLSANSQKPSGLNSGKALREYNDIETERFMTVGQAYERFYIDLAKLVISTAKDISESKKKLTVKVPGKKFIEEIDWKDVDMEDDEYVLKVFPVSSLPNEPAGRLQTIQEYAQAGFIAPRTARKLLEFPDLESQEDLANAEEECLRMVMDKIIEEGIYTPPDSFDDLQMAREMALEQIAMGKCSGLEEEKMEMLRTFITQIDMLSQMGQPQPVGGTATPQAAPQPQPVSENVPNVPGIQ